MKKLTDRKIAEILGVTPQNILFWKRNKPLQYEAVKWYLLFKENEISKKIKKINALATLIESECDSNYAKELKTIVDEIDFVGLFDEKLG